MLYDMKAIFLLFKDSKKGLGKNLLKILTFLIVSMS